MCHKRKSWRLRISDFCEANRHLVFFEPVFENSRSTKPHEPNHFETTQRSAGFSWIVSFWWAEAGLWEKWKPAHKGRRYHLARVAVEVQLN